MKYTYVLLCSDKNYYIGSTSDLKKRISRHKKGQVRATKYRLPVKLVYYEACPDLSLAKKREMYFKTGFGRKFLNNRINNPRSIPE